MRSSESMDIFQRYLDDIKSHKYNSEVTGDDLTPIINVRDENGRTLLHWASFIGNNIALAHLLHHGADASLASRTDENFQAIHFCTVNNHTDCVQTLLDHGVSLEARDMFQRTPLCVGAFYGRTVATVFLLSKRANVHHRDLNGNGALHFAAMSGNDDLCEILLYSGADIGATNDFGETVVHLASQRGSKRLLRALIDRAPASLGQCDSGGLTPLGHAKVRHNTVGAEYIERRLDRGRKLRPSQWRRSDLVYGRGASRRPLAFLVTMLFVVGPPVYVASILSLTYDDWPTLNWLFVLDGAVVMALLYAVNSTAPGYLPRYTKCYDDALRGLASTMHRESNIIDVVKRLCHTCRTVKPLRASHCAVCDRCVRDKDHHCPFVDNCIGYRNRQCFLALLCALSAGMGLAMVLVAIMRWQYDYRFATYEYVLLTMLVFYFCAVNSLLMSTVAGALANRTTNEAEKWHQYGYEYLRNEAGQFSNPFDKGAILNVLAFFRIIVTFHDERRRMIDV